MTRNTSVIIWCMLKEGDKIKASLKGNLVVAKELPSDPKEASFKSTSVASLSKDKTLVLYFYPKDSTPGCTIEAQNFRDDIKEFAKLNAIVIGVSKDKQSSHCKFMQKQEINFDLLSDESGDICEAFGVWQEKKLYGKTFMGIVRSTFVIENSKIVKVYPKVKVKDHAKELLDYLKNR